MTTPQTPLFFKIIQHLPLVEKILLTGLVAGTILRVLHMGSSVTLVALFGLATVYFLMAYRPIDIPRAEDERLGFPELLGLTILPKVLWLSCSISAVGIGFYLLDLGNDAYRKMLLVGGLTGGIASLILAMLWMQGTKHINFIAPVLIRVVPLCLVDFYLFWR